MSVAARLVLVVLAGLGVLGLAQALSLALRIDFANGLSNLPEYVRQLEEERELGRELAAKGEAILRRIEAKERIALAVIEGHLSLAKAVRDLRDCDRGRPDSEMECFRMLVPATCDEERYGLTLIRFAHTQLQDRPAQRQEVLRRLEAELRQLICDGRPDPP
jgi:hypothetical protein